MTFTFKDDFIERIKAEGRAEGKAEMLLQVLAARGLEAPAGLRERVLSCTDLGQLRIWTDKAATATSIKEAFPD